MMIKADHRFDLLEKSRDMKLVYLSLALYLMSVCPKSRSRSFICFDDSTNNYSSLLIIAEWLLDFSLISLFNVLWLRTLSLCKYFF